MATVAKLLPMEELRQDRLSGTPRAHSIDRWIFVGMAVWFIFVVLVGFIPDAVMKVDMVKAGTRPPFPPILHVHAVLMASFLLLLLAQSVMMATGRHALHKQVGIAAFALVPAMVVVGLILAPTMYYSVWQPAQAATGDALAALNIQLGILENILLLQISSGLVFAVLIAMALRARESNSGFHKRMMFLATSAPLAASIDRMQWLPNTLPTNSIGTVFWVLAAVSPMLIWDVVRNRRVHAAYLVRAAVYFPVQLIVSQLWNTPGWHAAARAIMRV